jgi:hypothetical protein
MASKNFIAPRLPVPPAQYDQQFMEQFTSILRLYFNQLDNASPAILASQNVGAANVVSGLTFSRPDPTNPALQKISLPTQADLANLRSGDVFYDTSGGTATSYPLKIKA